MSDVTIIVLFVLGLGCWIWLACEWGMEEEGVSDYRKVTYDMWHTLDDFNDLISACQCAIELMDRRTKEDPSQAVFFATRKARYESLRLNLVTNATMRAGWGGEDRRKEWRERHHKPEEECPISRR